MLSPAAWRRWNRIYFLILTKLFLLALYCQILSRQKLARGAWNCLQRLRREPKLRIHFFLKFIDEEKYIFFHITPATDLAKLLKLPQVIIESTAFILRNALSDYFEFQFSHHFCVSQSPFNNNRRLPRISPDNLWLLLCLSAAEKGARHVFRKRQKVLLGDIAHSVE